MITRRRFLAVSVLLFGLGLPAAASAQLASTCDASLWAHVYHPARLVKLHDCMRVTGTIILKRPEKDGDIHIQLKLDKIGDKKSPGTSPRLSNNSPATSYSPTRSTSKHHRGWRA